ncbi:DUF2917 domain-containing protein [Chitinasiproducens palmae]|nr:DUF2917 domain-containing protein [Chitinasiproducens palmae]
MRAQVTRTDLTLEAGEQCGWRLRWGGSLRLDGPADARLWLTRDGDPRDYWLGAGETVTLRRGERVWLGNESTRALAVAVRTSHTAALPWADARPAWHREGARLLARWMPALGGAQRGNC